jgi:hypothetical protein
MIRREFITLLGGAADRSAAVLALVTIPTRPASTTATAPPS